MNQQRRPKKKRMPTVQKVMITLIVIALLVLATMIIYGISTMSNTQSPNINNQTDNRDPDENENQISRPDPTPRPRPELETGIEHYNPLTGEVMDLGLSRARPIAVVLNNLAEALPLNGVSQADIIYEYPVEGGLTRMLALYQDISGVEKIGSIRSARHYTVQLAHSYDAILVAAGRSPQAQQEVRTLNVPFLNEVEGPLRDVFFRDRNRIPGRRVENLHSVVITGERMMLWLPEYDFRLMHEDDFQQTLHFTQDGTPQNGLTSDETVVRYSSARATTFTYNQTEKLYYVRHANREFIDANDNSQPTFTNVLIINTPVTPIRGDTSGRLNVETTGSGTGYFMSGGKYIEINWMRVDQSFPFLFTQKDGSPLDFGIGKTYICIIPTNQEPTFS